MIDKCSQTSHCFPFFFSVTDGKNIHICQPTDTISKNVGILMLLDAASKHISKDDLKDKL